MCSVTNSKEYVIVTVCVSQVKRVVQIFQDLWIRIHNFFFFVLVTGKHPSYAPTG